MIRLFCNAESCADNCDHFCSLSEVYISGATGAYDNEDTSCKSYLPQPAAAQNYLKRAHPLTEIHCDVGSCLYHNGGSCRAPSLGIDGISAASWEQTQCSTFVLKY